MDISQNSLSNQALWVFYDRLLQQARELERSLATPSNRGSSVTPTGTPSTNDPITPIHQIDGGGASDAQDDENSSDPEDDDNTENNETSSPLGPDQRQVTIILSSTPVRSSDDSNRSPIQLSSSSHRTATPSELRVPVQPLRAFPPDLRSVPDIEVTQPEVLDVDESRHARRRIQVTRATVEAYRKLVDAHMGVRYNIYTEDTPSPDRSESTISEPGPIDSDVLSLITVNAYIEVSIVESTAYDISDLELASDGNCYIGCFEFRSASPRNRARFHERAWADLVKKAEALGDDYDTAYSKVCDYLRTRRKLVMFVDIGRHATVLTLVHDTKIATFFDTWKSIENDLKAASLCSSVIRSVFNETSEGWTLQLATVGKQDQRANNCGLHSLLRIRDELEDTNRYDTNETSANTMRLYLALRGAYGEDKYPLVNILY